MSDINNNNTGESDHLKEDQQKLIDELSKVNKQLIASERAKTNFLSNIRNEINNPITAILQLSGKICDGNIDKESMKKFAGLVYAETFSLDFQMRNIMMAADIESGEVTLSPVSINISSMISNVVDSFLHEINKKELKVQFHNEIDVGTIFVTDVEKTQIVINNLFQNAIQYSHQGGVIDIKCSIEEGVLLFGIQDYGIGFDVENESIIFDRFRQLDEGVTKTYKGHGLGLSLVKSLLEILDGRIDIESQNGKGSIFRISITESARTIHSEEIFSSEGNDFLFERNDEIRF